MVYLRAELLKASKWLGKASLIALISITLWLGAKLVLLSLDCREEALSIKHFQFKIDNIHVEDKVTMAVILKFENPSQRNIKILYISCDVRCDDYLHGVYSSDLSFSPFVVEKFSEQAKEIFIKNEKVENYIGKEMEIQAYAQVRIRLNYLSDIAIKATYRANVTL